MGDVIDEDPELESTIQRLEVDLAVYSNYLTRAEDPRAVKLSFIDLATSAMSFLAWVIQLYLAAYLPERAKRDAQGEDDGGRSEDDVKKQLAAAVAEIKALRGRVAALEMREGLAALEVDITAKLRDLGLSRRAAAQAAGQLMPTLQDALPRLARLDGAS